MDQIANHFPSRLKPPLNTHLSPEGKVKAPLQGSPWNETAHNHSPFSARHILFPLFGYKSVYQACGQPTTLVSAEDLWVQTFPRMRAFLTSAMARVTLMPRGQASTQLKTVRQRQTPSF